MKNIRDIIKQAIDIHVHIGPEIIPRKYTAQLFLDIEEEKLGGAVLKNHFYPTQPFINEIKIKSRAMLFGGIVLNNYVGGLNDQAVYASSIISKQPIVVWFPTISAENFLNESKFEIPKEWINKKNFSAKKSNEIEPVRVTTNGKLTPNAIKVLSMIEQYNAVLATGHIAWEESVILINKALEMGIKKIVVTHPIYQRIDMPLKIQKKLAKQGCFIEHSYSMYSIDKIPINKIASQIKAVGFQSVILSSDVGQPFSPSPSKALYQFALLLNQEGISEDELFTMLVANPKNLLSMDKNRV